MRQTVSVLEESERYCMLREWSKILGLSVSLFFQRLWAFGWRRDGAVIHPQSWHRDRRASRVAEDLGPAAVYPPRPQPYHGCTGANGRHRLRYPPPSGLSLGSGTGRSALHTGFSTARTWGLFRVSDQKVSVNHDPHRLISPPPHRGAFFARISTMISKSLE